MTVTVLRKLRGMDRAELKFRATAALRTRVNRARSSIKPPGWERGRLRLSAAAGLVSTRDALDRRDWLAAHRALAHHFVRRPALFPLDPRHLDLLAARVRSAFPSSNAAARADRVLEGRYDLLGYRDVRAGSPPDWHRDPVHGRGAPPKFWDAIPYLDPALGDHKVTWELNRHQHFLTLGRAWALTGDRRYYLAFVAQLTHWIRANPPLTGTNWASMLELGFRCLSWIWALHFFASAASPQDDVPWTLDLLVALDRQLVHVEENLSRYFSPNTHLTGEALALYVAGRCLPELEASSGRARLGREILLAEAERQVLPDGGHAELSTHYHRYSTDFYLFALNVAQSSSDPAASSFREPARRQARYLRAISDDRGRIPLIGDDDGGQLFPICGRSPADCADTLATAAVLLDDRTLANGPTPEETYWLCGTGNELDQRPFTPSHPTSTALPHSGYYVSRNRRGDHLVFDAGPHGYLNGGHAHADALSVVLTVAGRPLLVDPGTATYTMDPAVRDRFRSTVMHNSVTLDGRSQSITAGPFHWKSRIDAQCHAWQTGAARDYVAASHQGFAPLVHSREVSSIHGVGWTIVDRISGDRASTATAWWHFHPDWMLERLEPDHASLIHADGTRITFFSSAQLQHVTADGLDEYSPEYGRIQKTLCLQATAAGEPPLTIVTAIAVDGSLERARALASSVHS